MSCPICKDGKGKRLCKRHKGALTPYVIGYLQQIAIDKDRYGKRKT